MEAVQGKKTFYRKVEEALRSGGYQYYDGDRNIRGFVSISNY